MGEPAHDQYVTVRSPLVTRPMLSLGAISSLLAGPYLKKKKKKMDLLIFFFFFFSEKIRNKSILNVKREITMQNIWIKNDQDTIIFKSQPTNTTKSNETTNRGQQ